VRFEDAASARNAANVLNGSILGGAALTVTLDSNSPDMTKVNVANVPAGIEWQKIKDHFRLCGNVCFVNVGCASPSSSSTAEVRFEDAASARNAANVLNGSILGGAALTVTLDSNSPDMTKVNVANVPAGIEWQKLKDHFKQCGNVCFVQINGSSPGRVGGKGQWKPMQQMQAQAQMQAQMDMMMKMMMMSKGACKGVGFGGQAKGGQAKGSQAKGGQAKGGQAKGGLTGEVRYESPMGAQAAAMTLNGTPLRGSPITVGVDGASKDLVKVWVTGIPFGTTWQELKDHMAWAGAVVFANVS